MDNQEWIHALVRQHERPLCRYAYSLTGDTSRAQDAVQETFLRLCKQDRRSIEGHEAAWLFKVCRSRALDMKRKEKPMESLHDQPEACMASPGKTPAESVIQQDTEQLLPSLVDQLPPPQREVIRLKFQQCLSYREIARITELSESNVGYLIHNGIKALRDQMNTLQGVSL